MSTGASDPLFDLPEVFVMEPADLTLPQHPDSNHMWFCNSKRIRTVEDIKTGINPDKAVSEDNLPRTLTRYMSPYLDNLKEVADELNARAQQAKHNFLEKQIDLEYDYVGLQQVIRDIEHYHEDVNLYRQLTYSVQNMEDFDQGAYLTNHVFKPVFSGGGFDVIGDESSEWVTFLPYYCSHLRLGKALNEAVNYHVDKWHGMGYGETTAEGGPSRGEQRSSTGKAIGLLGVVILGAWLYKR